MSGSKMMISKWMSGPDGPAAAACRTQNVSFLVSFFSIEALLDCLRWLTPAPARQSNGKSVLDSLNLAKCMCALDLVTIHV